MLIQVRQLMSLKFLLLSCAIILTMCVTNIVNPLRDTLIVKIGHSGGVQVVAIIRLLTGIPSALFIIWLINKWKERYLPARLQTNVAIFFISFFFIFALIFPYSSSFQASIETISAWQNSSSRIWHWSIAMFGNWFFVVFYVFGGCWTLANFSIIFWHITCITTSKEETVNFFILLPLIGTIGGILAGILSNYLKPDNTKEYDKWISGQLFVVCCSIIFLIVIYRLLLGEKRKNNIISNKKEKRQSIIKIIKSIYKNKLAFSILKLTFCYYLISALIELIWKEKLKQIYLEPSDYIRMTSIITILANISFVLISIFSLYLLKHRSWIATATITPILMVTTGLIFLIGTYIMNNFENFVTFIIFYFGTASVIFSLASKNSAFNTSKNLAYKKLLKKDQMLMRIAIESLGSRGGEFLASFIIVLCTNFIFPGMEITEPSIIWLLFIVVGLCFIIWIKSIKTINSTLQRK